MSDFQPAGDGSGLRVDLLAIADLIESATEASARAAQRSLEGVFSEAVNQLQQELIDLRVFVEAAMDFPDEEIDFLADSDVLERLAARMEAMSGPMRVWVIALFVVNGVSLAIDVFDLIRYARGSRDIPTK